MRKLIAELQRLYFLPDQHWQNDAGDDSRSGAAIADALARSLDGEFAIELRQPVAEGQVRLMRLNFRKARDWEAVAQLYQAVQDELDLPRPAISVSAESGFHLWFSLAVPISVGSARSFLEALRRRYLAEIPVAHIEFFPGDDSAVGVTLVPALQRASGKWSAFIDPSMGSMFVEESGLDMAPNMERQADMLAALKSIKAEDFARAVELLLAPVEVASPMPALACGESDASPVLRQSAGLLGVGSNFTDPAGFLLAVMNDATVSASHRIEAAKALLPYFAGPAK